MSCGWTYRGKLPSLLLGNLHSLSRCCLDGEQSPRLDLLWFRNRGGSASGGNQSNGLHGENANDSRSL
jgi:hypothetical protein